MALETFFVLALATGRTLVLPDSYNMYLLGASRRLIGRTTWSSIASINPFRPAI